MDAGGDAIVVPHAVKRRRTKRQRHFPVTMAPTSSSSSEEKDMANCLILLARSGPPPEKIISKVVARNGKAKVFFFVCKTCHKRFPTFQALGGHRTSHKKLNNPITPAQEKKVGESEEDSIQLTMNSFSNSNNGKAARVHECVICRAVFSSGQALGGHMRRHRQTSLPEPVETKEEEKNEKKNIVMSLDLNLPASEDNDNCSGGGELQRSTSAAATTPFSLASKPPLLSLSLLWIPSTDEQLEDEQLEDAASQNEIYE